MTGKYFLAIALLVTASAHAADEEVRHFSRQCSIGKHTAALIIVGYTRDAAAVEQLIEKMISGATQIEATLDAHNPASEVAKLNTANGQATIVASQLIEILQSAKNISAWTDGVFDVSAGSAKGNYKSIRLDEKKSTVKLAKGMSINLDGLVDGYLADLLIRYAAAAGMQNALVRVGNAFRGMGQSVVGPWRIEVEDELGTYAHRALTLTVANTGVATLSATAFRNTPVTPDCHGVTVVMSDAVLAQGVANAVFVLGQTEGMKLLARLGNAKGMIVDNTGNFLRSPGF